MKTCFVICPLGAQGSLVRQRSDQLLDLVIKPTLLPLGYEVTRADLGRDIASITSFISEHIFRDDLVIADLTDLNPNVFYELGKRHAWGGKCIQLVQSIRSLPFDIKDYRSFEYDLSNPEKLENLRRDIRLSVLALDKIPAQCPYPLTPDDVIRLAGSTVLAQRVTTRRDHYYIARNLAELECERMFLMQRSSSLILGPEQGWGAESIFYSALVARIDAGVEFLHIVSLEGIARHLARPQSTFPNVGVATDRLVDSNGLVGVVGPNKPWLFKRTPDLETDEDLKPDRQARIFLVELKNGTSEGVIVFDLGGTQSCFHIKGPEMKAYMRECMEFYHDCPYLRWDELLPIIDPYLIH